MSVIRRAIFALVAMIVLLWDTPAAALAATMDHPLAQESKSFWTTAQIYFGNTVAIIAIVFFASKLIMRSRRRQREEDRRKRLKRKARQLKERLEELRQLATPYFRAMKDYDQAREYLAIGKVALHTGNFDKATENLRRAQDFLNYGWEAIRIDSRDTRGAIRMKRPDGTIVTINHLSHDPETQSTICRPYFWTGGIIGGERWERGYYPDRFWTWTYLRTLFGAPDDTQTGDQ